MIEILQELVFNNKMINHAFVNVFQSERIMFFKSDGLTLGTPPGYSLSSDFFPEVILRGKTSAIRGGCRLLTPVLQHFIACS